ncbi:MAG: putative nucleotidyltransferase substrate binding domain-containing protein [Pseudomonadota bacterium]
MDAARADMEAFVRRHHPFDSLSEDAAQEVLKVLKPEAHADGAMVFGYGQTVDGLRIVARGEVELLSANGDLIAEAHAGDSVGSRALFNDGIADQAARAKAADGESDVVVYRLPAETFAKLVDGDMAFRAFFQRFVPTDGDDAASGEDASLMGVSLESLMTPNPVTVPGTMPVREAASIMAERHISCVLVVEGERLVGLLTTGDITNRVVAAQSDPNAPVQKVMTRDPMAFSPDDSGFDAMLAMSSKGIGHLPIVEDGRPVGIITRTNLVRRQQVSAVYMIGDMRRLSDTVELSKVVDQIPGLLVQLVGSGVAPHKIGRVITSIADALTVRLLELAEEKFGPPPVSYLWLACGSQGRREQTGVSDQDNCLILHDAYDADAHGSYFRDLAAFVSDGLDEAGYFYCPGDMMATNERWRQPVSVWRGYFEGWVHKPDPMAQMLASVMFDLSPISGDFSLFDGLQRRTLDLAKANSIFRAHMTANSLKHTPPLSLFRGFALIRSGEHKNTVDLKHNGVVPIVDLARLYALEGALEAVNTRERIEAAQEAGTVSKQGGRDLLDAFDLISTVRLRHQARQIRDGEKPDNFLAPSRLSAFERNHLKDAFGVIKGLQSSLGHGRTVG